MRSGMPGLGCTVSGFDGTIHEQSARLSIGNGRGAHHAFHLDLPAVEVRDGAGETVGLCEGTDDLWPRRWLELSDSVPLSFPRIADEMK